jgi:hypothetical protein
LITRYWLQITAFQLAFVLTDLSGRKVLSCYALLIGHAVGAQKRAFNVKRFWNSLMQATAVSRRAEPGSSAAGIALLHIETGTCCVHWHNKPFRLKSACCLNGRAASDMARGTLSNIKRTHSNVDGIQQGENI